MIFKINTRDLLFSHVIISPEFVGDVAKELLLLAMFHTVLIPSTENRPSSEELTSRTFSEKN